MKSNLTSRVQTSSPLSSSPESLFRIVKANYPNSIRGELFTEFPMTSPSKFSKAEIEKQRKEKMIEILQKNSESLESDFEELDRITKISSKDIFYQTLTYKED